MSRSRDYCFTFNNPTPETAAAFEAVECTYLIIGHEVGASGTPHFQGYIRFKAGKSFTAVKSLLPPGTHIEVKKGTCQQAIDYCKKDGDYKEIGEAPISSSEKGCKEKRRWEDAFEAAKLGNLDEIPADIRVKYYKTIKAIRSDHMEKPEPLSELDNEWRYGPTGTGKSRTAQEAYPDAYLKSANEKWWDGYSGQEVVIIDDFDKYFVKMGYYLKIWLDHYPFIAETKGGSSMIRPKKIIVTSNYHPSEIWEDDTTLQPVLRRVKCIKYDTLLNFDST